MDLNNYPFLKYIAKQNKTIVLSTGLSNFTEIKKAVKTIEKEKLQNNYSTLYCNLSDTR